MKTDGIGAIPNVQNVTDIYQSNKKQADKTLEKAAKDIYSSPLDTYIPSAEGAADPAKVQSLWKETNHMGEAVKKLIASALGIDDGSGQGFWALRAKNFKVSEEDRAEAQKLISEDGYFGVVQTSKRIMDFAKALVGEDASAEKIEEMRKSVQKGFDEVAKLFGGFDKLPDVTKETYDAIMKEFDKWAGIDTETETKDEE